MLQNISKVLKLKTKASRLRGKKEATNNSPRTKSTLHTNMLRAESHHRELEADTVGY
jgi:hypothetical protein